MTDVKICYETYNNELLIIVIFFKHWCHYLNGSQYSIEVFINHNNLWYFMSKARLNEHQSWWFMISMLYDFVIVHWFSTHNPVDEPFHWPNYKQGWEKVDCLSTLQWKFYNLSVGALCLPEVWQWVTLNIYELCFICVLMLQYFWFKEERKAEVRMKKWPANPESSQIGAIKMWRKKCRSVNFNLKMQKRPREGLLEILKSYEDL